MAKRIVETLVTELTADGAKLRSEMDKSLKDAKAWGDKLAKISKNVALFGAAGGVAIGGGLVALTKNSIDNADAMSKQAQAVGMAIEKLSAYSYAAEMGGVEQEKFVASLGKFNRVIAEAYQGVGSGVDAFEALGISITDSNGKLKNNSDLFAEVADRFKYMPDGIEKSALAMDLFGRSGADLIPVLNGGKQSLTEMTAEAERLGLVISEDTGKNAELFNDNLEKMQKALVGLGNSIAEKALPSLNEFTSAINDPATQEGIAELANGAIKFGTIIVDLTSKISKLAGEAGEYLAKRWNGIDENQIKDVVEELERLKTALDDPILSLANPSIPNRIIDMSSDELKVEIARLEAKKRELLQLKFDLVGDDGKFNEVVNLNKPEPPAVMTRTVGDIYDPFVDGPNSVSWEDSQTMGQRKQSPVFDPFLDSSGAMDYEKFQAQQAAADREVDLQRDKFRRIHEEKLLAQGLDVELENYQYALEKEQLAKELESLREKNILTSELENEFKTAELEMEEAHQARLKEIKDRAAQEDLQRRMAQLQGAEELFGNLYELSATFGNKQSRLSKTFFALSKAASIAQSIIAIQAGIAEAQKKGMPLGLIEGVAIAAQGAKILSTMRSTNIAHGGLDSVPKESTYLLDQGERVVSPRQNKDLTEFLKDPGNKKGVTVNVINQAGDTKVDVRETASGIDVIVTKVVDKIKDGIARGNGIDTTLRSVYPQLIRRGS